VTSIVIMGVSGSGKSTVGAQLARRLGLPFVDGDDLHSRANKQKMAAGISLDDADRAPWLDDLSAALARSSVVVACSALKRAYRDRLRDAVPGVKFVYLAGSPALLAQRTRQRAHEFMPPGLLASQLGILEPPGPDENALTVDIAPAPLDIVE
jgi:carbohydrate kinase (thermoresistant glucokinase family)